VWSGDEEPIERALVICAHPDDVDFVSAGTVAALGRAGTEVRYCIITDGEAGGSDRTQTREQMAKVRRSEQVAAAAAVGVSDVTFLGYPDGRLAATFELRRDLSGVIRRWRPDLVIAPTPERNWDSIYAGHPDHLAAGEAAIAAVYPDSRNPFAHPELLAEGLEPHVVQRLWLAAHRAFNLAVDVTETLDAKVAALACHVSQGIEAATVREWMLGWATGSAASAGMAEGRLAELFFSLPVG
jgi:LmbE family N-acetylglucosaminyl deacetylase